MNPKHVKEVIAQLEQLCELALVQDNSLSADAARNRLQLELSYYRNLELESHSLSDVYKRFCTSLANRAGMFKLVFGGSGRFSELQGAYAQVLCDFEAKEITRVYGKDHVRLLAALVKARGLNPDQAARQLNQPTALFQIYAKGALSGAEYFAKFASITDFANNIRSWLTDADRASLLPQHLASQSIPGFGSALAADFLKEIGVKELCKPDRWVQRCLAAARFVPESASYESIQRAFWEMWRILGKNYPPVIIDKLMFLVGSGRFEMAEPTFNCRPRFSEFEDFLSRQSES